MIILPLYVFFSRLRYVPSALTPTMEPACLA
jgi:hypothetical protein